MATIWETVLYLPSFDAAITTLTENGELEAITQEWLSDFTGAPVVTVE